MGVLPWRGYIILAGGREFFWDKNFYSQKTSLGCGKRKLLLLQKFTGLNPPKMYKTVVSRGAFCYNDIHMFYNNSLTRTVPINLDLKSLKKFPTSTLLTATSLISKFLIQNIHSNPSLK